MSKKLLYGLLLFVAAVLFIVVTDTATLINPGKIKGEFREVLFKRNGNNMGPVLRIYTVAVRYPQEADYQAYGNTMPHTPPGTTTVYFFEEGLPMPESLSIEEPNFNKQKFQPVAIYKKNGAGTVQVDLFFP